MVPRDGFVTAVEVAHRPCANVDRAHSQPRRASAEKGWVDQRLQRVAQGGRVVVAGVVRVERDMLAEPGPVVRCEEAGQAMADGLQGRPERRQPGQTWPQRRQALVRYRVPEPAQPIQPVFGPVADDQGRIDGADRGADHPVGLDAGLVKGFIDPRLVGAHRAAALQH